MNRRGVWIGSLLAAACAAIAAASPGQVASDLVVHEWGTFLSMQGSDGSSLDGMYHEEHALPAFVHARSRDQLRIPSAIVKGETPVIYFYTERQQRVSVRVDFPQGVWTQWYPQASLVGPQFAQVANPGEPRNGKITWNAEIIPARGKQGAVSLPRAGSDALWNFSREVDAAYVRTSAGDKAAETDRFIFYRGLGQAPLPASIVARKSGALTLSGPALDSATHLFVIRVEKGKGAYRYLPDTRGERFVHLVPSMKDALPLEQFSQRIADDLAGRLAECGLYPKEARAMVNTWRSSYFENEGTRVLFVLPRRWVDEAIPIRITPAPRELVRVMVGRIEVLTPERERLVETAVRDLSSSEPVVREKAFELLRGQGRYVEPVVRRVLRTTTDERVKSLCQRLLLTDFATELRAAIHDAADGRRLQDDPVHVRAQLALLLREMGLDEEARAEAGPVLEALRKRGEPPMERSTSRHYFRANARALEAMGDTAGATRAYEKFIRFGAQVATSESCRGCHVGLGSAAPREMAWYRDWWAGRKYAESALRAGPETLRQAEARMEQNPRDVAARMMAAYLAEARGDRKRSAEVWAAIPGADRKVAATVTE